MTLLPRAFGVYVDWWAIGSYMVISCWISIYSLYIVTYIYIYLRVMLDIISRNTSRIAGYWVRPWQVKLIPWPPAKTELSTGQINRNLQKSMAPSMATAKSTNDLQQNSPSHIKLVMLLDKFQSISIYLPFLYSGTQTWKQMSRLHSAVLDDQKWWWKVQENQGYF